MPVPEPLPEWGPGGLLPARPAQTRPRPVVAFLRSLPLPPPTSPDPLPAPLPRTVALAPWPSRANIWKHYL